MSGAGDEAGAGADAAEAEVEASADGESASLTLSQEQQQERQRIAACETVIAALIRSRRAIADMAGARIAALLQASIAPSSGHFKVRRCTLTL